MNKISIRVVCVNGKRPRSYLVLSLVSLKQKDQKHGFPGYIVKESAGNDPRSKKIKEVIFFCSCLVSVQRDSGISRSFMAAEGGLGKRGLNLKWKTSPIASWYQTPLQISYRRGLAITTKSLMNLATEL